MQKLNGQRVGAAAFLWVAIVMMVGCEAPAPQRSTPQHSTITYGRITAVDRVTLENAGAQTAGALVGGSLGMLSGSGQSSSNRALRGVGGAFAGQQLARAVSNEQGFRYTILSNGRTFTVVTDGASLRVGDCVSVERGQFNNIRLAPDSSCPATGAAVTPSREAISEADACDAAKEQLLQATDDAAFGLAERRVRLLCDNN
jgi:outer membrane lipoprotein SlyB